MSDNLPVVPEESIIANTELRALSPEERVEIAREAHDAFIRGRNVRVIAQRAQISEEAAVALINEELYRTQHHRPNPGHIARARMSRLIEMASDVLESPSLNATSQNQSRLMQIILDAQTRLDSYDALDAPKRTENVNINVAELIKEAVRKEKDGHESYTYLEE